jgi:lysophospholipase L1-like esterase
MAVIVENGETAVNKYQSTGFGKRVAIIGTSLVQQCNDAVDSGSNQRLSVSTRSWVHFASFFMNGAIDIPVVKDNTTYTDWGDRDFWGLNLGVSGQTAQEVLDRLPQVDGLLPYYDIIIVDAGTNDVASGDADDIQSTREEICNYLLNKGKTVILLTILARETSEWASGSSSRKKANYINQKSREYVDGKKNAYLYDWNTSWVDGTDADGQPVSGYSGDGTHFDVPGAFAVGKDFATFMERIVPEAPQRWISPDDIYDATYNIYGNLHSNSNMTGTSGSTGTGASGDVADTLRLERNSGSSTVVGSKETRSDGRGYNQVMTFTNVGSGTDKFYLRNTSPTDTTHNLSSGDFIRGSIAVECNATDSLVGIKLHLEDIDGTNGILATSFEEYDYGSGETNWPEEAFTGTIITPIIKLADSSTKFRWRVEILVDANGSTAPIIKLGCAEVRQVGDPNYPTPAS